MTFYRFKKFMSMILSVAIHTCASAGFISPSMKFQIIQIPLMRHVLESFSVTSKPLLILASNSPRRRQLLALADWMFNVIVADVDESMHQNELPADYVLRLAETKARATASRAHADQIILAADTTVVDGSDILGKPKDNVEAFAMLTRLRGHTHQVYTGVALLRLSDGLLLK